MSLDNLTLKQARKEARERFLAGRKAETQYANALRSVAKQIDTIVRGFAPNGVLSDPSALIQALQKYSEILHPWGESVAWRMISDVSKRDAAAWTRHGQMIGRALRQEIQYAPTGAAMQRLLQQRVKEITSIPTDAAQRLFKLTTEARSQGTRADVIAAEIMRSGEVSAGTARMLARTGVSSTATALTRARAEHVGSDGYIGEPARMVTCARAIGLWKESLCVGIVLRRWMNTQRTVVNLPTAGVSLKLSFLRQTGITEV